MKTNISFILLSLVFSVFAKYSLADYPIVSQRFLADPGALVYKGRVYIYCSNDDENPMERRGGYQMQSIVYISSSDLKNWTDHGVVLRVPEGAAWANRSWAPSPAEQSIL
jgi:arabinoxylan arabinofuranohydrolase